MSCLLSGQGQVRQRHNRKMGTVLVALEGGVINADGTILRHRQERGRRFSGKESFNHAISAHGLDSGTGLGRVIEPDTMKERP